MVCDASENLLGKVGFPPQAAIAVSTGMNRCNRPCAPTQTEPLPDGAKASIAWADMLSAAPWTQPPKGSGTHGATLSAPIAAYEIVRVMRGVTTAGYCIPKGTSGTVVAAHDGGATYAVETADLPGGSEVVTSLADQIERMH